MEFVSLVRKKERENKRPIKATENSTCYSNIYMLLLPTIASRRLIFTYKAMTRKRNGRSLHEVIISLSCGHPSIPVTHLV